VGVCCCLCGGVCVCVWVWGCFFFGFVFGFFFFLVFWNDVLVCSLFSFICFVLVCVRYVRFAILCCVLFVLVRCVVLCFGFWNDMCGLMILTHI
jgi:hypothetical protein